MSSITTYNNLTVKQLCEVARYNKLNGYPYLRGKSTMVNYMYDNKVEKFTNRTVSINAIEEDLFTMFFDYEFRYTLKFHIHATISEFFTVLFRLLVHRLCYV